MKGSVFYPETETAPAVRCLAICSVGELFGGVERHILGIVSSLRDRGISVVMILFHDGELAAQAREQGIESLILPSQNRSLLTTSGKLAHILEQRRIRVVHIHGYKATVFCALARWRYPFAMVKTEHGLPEPMPRKPIGKLRDHLYYLLDSVAARMAGATVCYVTEGLLDYYRHAHAGLPVMVIPNGIGSIDPCHLRRPPEIREGRFNVVIVGRLDAVKGHHVAIEAIASKGIPADLDLYIVGVGPRESELRALAAAHGITDRVHFLGFRRNVYDYMAHCHALLMPSLHEGLPYTLLEAMALGTPVIASRVGGLAEVLQDGVTALLAPPRDATALVRAIITLYDDSEFRHHLAENAKRLQHSQYSLEAMAEHYLRVYQGLQLTANPPSAPL